MQATAPAPADVTVQLVNQSSQVDELVEAISQADRVAVDTETHSAITIDDLWYALRVASYATQRTTSFGVEYRTFVVDARDVSVESFRRINSAIEVAQAWNANFDDRVFRIFGAPIRKWRDAMIADALYHAGVPGFDFYHGLAVAVKRYTGFEMSGKGTTQTSYTATSELSAEQVRYAGMDAYLTLLTSERLDALAEKAGIKQAVDLDNGGRPFIAAMMEYGFPLDVDGWREFLAQCVNEQKVALITIRDLTGGGKVEYDLFNLEGLQDEKPSWNVESNPERKNALNQWASTLVRAFTGGAPLGPTDTLDKVALKKMIRLGKEDGSAAALEQIRLCQALLDYGKHAKLIQTYGESFLKHVKEGNRLRPRYKQALTATGRLASDKPNAQNLPPEMKAYIHPETSLDAKGKMRVFVHNDLSQAELRVLAHLAQENRMLEMFLTGKDFHTLTAADMLKIDMEALEKTNPTAFADERKKAKGVNFGIPYGLGAAALAQSLTENSGVKTTKEEAQALLKAYSQSYPNVDAWLGERDGFIRSLAESQKKATGETPDWELTMRLNEMWIQGDTKRKNYKRQNKNFPTGEVLAEMVQSDHELRHRLEAHLGRPVTDEDVSEERQRQAAAFDWAFGFDAPVVLKSDGTPVGFESRTVSGRYKRYEILVDSTAKDKFAGVLTSAALLLATSDKPDVAAMRDEFARKYQLDLPTGTRRPSDQDARKSERTRTVKAFEGDKKYLKAEFVKAFFALKGQAGGHVLLQHSLAEQIRQMGNQYRNMPIQGTVADIVLKAFETIFEKLSSYQDAYPVQSVHDSIVIECNVEDAEQIANDVKEALEAAMNLMCPTVLAKADADVRRTLSDKSVLSHEDIEAIKAGTYQS